MKNAALRSCRSVLCFPCSVSQACWVSSASLVSAALCVMEAQCSLLFQCPIITSKSTFWNGLWQPHCDVHPISQTISSPASVLVPGSVDTLLLLCLVGNVKLSWTFPLCKALFPWPGEVLAPRFPLQPFLPSLGPCWQSHFPVIIKPLMSPLYSRLTSVVKKFSSDGTLGQCFWDQEAPCFPVDDSNSNW